MKRLLLFAALMAGSCAVSQPRPSTPRPPNIILVMTDDQGIGDFGCAGNPVLETPRLDAFAAQCPQFDRFYVSPVCSPTRASLLTGRYNYRTRVVDTWIGRSMMEPDEVTLAELLRDAGYRTGIFGKWHLGDCYPMRPMDQGFDEVLVHRGGGLAQPSEPLANEGRYTNPILFHNGRQTQTEGYCTDVYFDAAMRFVDEAVDRDQPFFAYVATNAPHSPLRDVPEELLAKYRAKDLAPVVASGSPPNLDHIARVFAMIENIDQNFGRLLDHLDARGLANDTIVVFLGDNGPDAGRYVRGLRGSKASVYEGGIRSPLWMRWPGRLDPAVRTGRVAAHIDVLPTLCAMADVAVPKDHVLDGRSLLPLLRGEAAAGPDRHLVLQTHRGDVPQPEHHFAVIGERWKLVRHSGFHNRSAADEVPFELFDLASDPGERMDVAARHEDRVAELREIYRAWFESVSTTRVDNFDKPRIRIGTQHEPHTVLTRQDWVAGDGVGWGHEGAWLLHAPRACRLRVTLVFRKPRAVERYSVQARGVDKQAAAAVVGDRVVLGELEFPAGDLDLRITCENEDGPFAPYQVELELR